MPAAALIAGAVLLIGIVLAAWWWRERRLRQQHQAQRTFYTLAEEVIAATDARGIAERLALVLPAITRATGVSLYLFNQRAKSLERVPTEMEPEPMAAPIDDPPEGLANAAVVCFRGRNLLHVPDVRGNPLVRVGAKIDLPRSAMFVPLLAKNEVLGVLELSSANRLGYFSQEEQYSAQHLANQVAASLKLQEQQALREQWFRGEKLAATGQLISRVAAELRAPLEAISRYAADLAENTGSSAQEPVIRQLEEESQRASELVTRLVSYRGDADTEPVLVDVHEVLAGLIRFREPEWAARGLQVHARMAPSSAMVAGSRSQIEQVFLSLLLFAEQRAAQSAQKTLELESSPRGGKIEVEVRYSAPDPPGPEDLDPFAGAASEAGTATGLAQGIVESYGGRLGFASSRGIARFEAEFPLDGAMEPRRDPLAVAAPVLSRPLTLLLIDAEPQSRKEFLYLLGGRGHRVVPTAVEQAAEVVHRIPFDAVIWAVRAQGGRWSDFRERAGRAVRSFVLVAEAFDRELAWSLEASGGFLLARPVNEAELDRILARLSTEARS